MESKNEVIKDLMMKNEMLAQQNQKLTQELKEVNATLNETIK